MSELDQLDAWLQTDTGGLLARAARTLERSHAAASAVETWRAQTPLPSRLPDRLPLTLVLPPELRGVGEMAAQIVQGDDGTLSLAQTPVLLGAAPQPRIRVGGHDLPLASCVRAADHPAQTLWALLGVLAAVQGDSPVQPAPDAALLAALARCSPSTPTAENPAKQLALRLHDRIGCFWGEGMEAAAARVWAARRLWLAESMALATDQDELSRLLVMARFPRFWPNAGCWVRLVTPGAPGDLADAVERILSRRRFGTLVVHAPEGLSPLDRALYWLEMGEWVALYAAALNNVDPAAHVPLDLLFAGS